MNSIRSVGQFLYSTRYTIASICGWVSLASLAHYNKQLRMKIKEIEKELELKSNPQPLENPIVEKIPDVPSLQNQEFKMY
jgi:hypothetical protein